MFDSLQTTTHTDAEHRIMEYESNIEPDKNFFKNLTNDCPYYIDDQFNRKIKVENNITVVHYNSISLYETLLNIKEHLIQFKTPFSVIAVLETWITPEKCEDNILRIFKLFIKKKLSNN